MKNKKGFTIVEIIAVIALLAIIAGIFSVNMIQTLNKNKDEEKKNVITQITTAADVYVSTNPEKIEKLYRGYGYVDISIGDLRNAGLLNEELKDPSTGIRIKDEEVVRVSLQTGDYIMTKYPLTEEEKNIKTYTLVAEDLFIQYDETIPSSYWCNDDSKVYIGLFDKSIYTVEDYVEVASKLYLMDNSLGNRGAIYPEDSRTSPVNLKKTSCNVDPQRAGSYTINYSYNDPKTNTLKITTRNVYVKANENMETNLP